MLLKVIKKKQKNIYIYIYIYTADENAQCGRSNMDLRTKQACEIYVTFSME